MNQSKVEALAEEMGVTPADLLGWLAAVSVWIAKGYDFERAIEKHMEQMRRLAENSVKIAIDCADDFVSAIHDHANKSKGRK